jgi:uncharacterized protein (TIGR03089 family)
VSSRLRLVAPGPPPPAAHIPGALATARDRLGHRPALTVHRRDGRREEQGFASLAQWAAKGAHLIEADLLLGPGDRIGVDAPAGWLPAAVMLAAWWAGVTVVPPGEEADVWVVHEAAPVPDGEVFVVGDAVDGAPTAPTAGEPWVTVVQAFPDQPPPPRAEPDMLALDGPEPWTHAALVVADDVDGPMGVQVAGRGATDVDLVRAIVRPLVTGHATVLVEHDDRAVADAERIAVWR